MSQKIAAAAVTPRAEDPPSSPATTRSASLRPEQRQHLRFDKVFPVRVESILFGQIGCVARNVSAGGIFLESRDPLPLGARVQICFLTPDETGEVIAHGEVKNHYFINYNDRGETRSVAGMAVRFLGFEEGGQQNLRACLDRLRVLH